MTTDELFIESLSTAERMLVDAYMTGALPPSIERPNPKHRCRAIVVGINADRCACGAVRLKTRAYWVWRNTR